ncbi:carbohydrate esterase family 16 protein [Dothidotthia symphoricarpi CBS 119687]|uniref:Carbohydrate esterase family 16 protein n=1 Tax=Dothidotthia symphoricarpi CBS 119687 TaxID=1392245 RepID=A0A6A6A355_9PLEO|nr:carbohydrate esterase family 16 protein [Dothidotthia symphoricarpi CBS 119687]KAF2125337.1 carbohydrate esterase family 16 protein [Dothidotthia symphoricarpi CBS 119687]
MRLKTTVCVSLAATTLANPTRLKNSTFNWHTTKSVIAFGDSYTYVQGLQGHINYTYINDNFDLSFTPDELFSDRIVQNATLNTASGGPNWVEYLTGCGVATGLTDPRKCKTQLWDFAYAGADVSVELTPLHWNHTVSLEKQIEQFVAYGDPALQSVVRKKDALVAVWIGINDINDLIKLRGKNTSFTPLYEQIQRQQFGLMEKVYGLGYKNFLFMNLPPLDRGPSPSVNASLVETFNDVLKTHADQFQAEHRDASVLQFDVNTVLNGVLDDYEKYGFKNVTAFCPGYNQPDIRTNPEKYGCGEGLSTYFWYNSGHLTSRTHEVFTKTLRKWLVSKSGR